jgi:hypothetical protein
VQDNFPPYKRPKYSLIMVNTVLSTFQAYCNHLNNCRNRNRMWTAILIFAAFGVHLAQNPLIQGHCHFLKDLQTQCKIKNFNFTEFLSN